MSLGWNDIVVGASFACARCGKGPLKVLERRASKQSAMEVIAIERCQPCHLSTVPVSIYHYIPDSHPSNLPELKFLNNKFIVLGGVFYGIAGQASRPSSGPGAPPPLSALVSKVAGKCECGAQKLGYADFTGNHAYWCPVASPSGYQRAA